MNFWRSIFVVLVICLLVSCGDTHGPSSPSGNAAPFTSPLLGPYVFTPPSLHAPGGQLVFSDLQWPSAPNPLFASSSADFEIDAALWARPVFFDQQFHVHPDQLTEVPLPENGDVLDGGKLIIMHLRHDLRWSDGQPLQSGDFAYWWRLNQDADTGATITTGYDQIASIDTPDAFTVLLHLHQPFGPYLFYLPFAAPQHSWSRLRPIDLQGTPAVYQMPQVTSGPYMSLSLTAGQRYILEPNPHYVSTTFHGPYLSRLIYRATPTVAALSDAARMHASDVTLGYTEDDRSSLKAMPGDVSVLEMPAASYEHLDFNLAHPLLRDLNLRRAVQSAIDRCGLLKVVLHAPDCSRLANQVELAPSLYHDSAITTSAYDPSAARALLAGSGWSPGAQGMLTKGGQILSLHLVTTTDSPVRAAAAMAIQRDLQAIGIQVQVAFYPLNAFFGVYTQGGILATGAYDLALFSYENSVEPDDEYTVFHSSQIPSADHPNLGNYGRVNDQIIDTTLMQGRTTVAISDRLEAYHRFLEQLAAQTYVIPLYVDVNVMTVDQRVHNILPNPDQSLPTWNIADWWVA